MKNQKSEPAGQQASLFNEPENKDSTPPGELSAGDTIEFDID